MESILTTTKKLLGIEEDYTHFDTEIILNINSALFVLNQLGVGPPEGFVITGNADTWTDFLSDRTYLEAVKTYVYLKVRLTFDPPQMGYLVDAITKQISELEWRIEVMANGDPQASVPKGPTVILPESPVKPPITYPTYISPSFSLAGSQPLIFEIGESITPILTPAWAQKDAGSITQYRLFRDSVNIHTSGAASAFTDSSFFLLSDTSYQGEVEYEQGPTKNDSEGTPHLVGRISAGTKTSNVITYMPKRKAFYGPLDGLAKPDSSEVVRSLSNSHLNPSANTKFIVTVPTGAKGLCFALSTPLPGSTIIISQLLGNIPISNFTYEVVSVDGANGQTPANYHVYYTMTVAAFKMEDTYTLTL